MSSFLFYLDINECNSTTLNTCEQLCINAVPGFSCSCESGFLLDANRLNCTSNVLINLPRLNEMLHTLQQLCCVADINECEGSHPCHQVCEDTEGSFFCSCNSGFRLLEDDINCLRM